MTIVDRSGPGVRITLLDNERAPSGEPLDLAGRIIAFTYEDAEKKADQVSLQLDGAVAKQLLTTSLVTLREQELKRTDRLVYAADSAPLLEVRDLSIRFPQAHVDYGLVLL